MGGVSIISGSLSGAQGAFPARQILFYYGIESRPCQVCGRAFAHFLNLPDLQYVSIFEELTSNIVAT